MYVLNACDTKICLRRIAREDLPALQRFDASLSAATRSHFLPHAYDTATLERMIARAETGQDLALVAYAGSVLIAYCFLWELRDPVPVLGIGLADAWQGKGLGAQCLRPLIDAARAAGCHGIQLTTVPGNTPAFALYQKMGFLHTGDADNIAGDGRTVREHVMFLPLTPGACPPDRTFAPPE